MKIAINLTGIIYGLNVGQRKTNVDWHLSRDFITEMVISPFKELNHDVDVYLTTYATSSIDELIKYYAPKELQVLKFEGSHQKITYLKSLEKLLNVDVDFIVSTRFDIAFNKKLTEYPINYNKFNFLVREYGAWWETHNYVNDALFMFPKKYLTQFIDAIREEHITPYHARNNPPQPDLHTSYRYLVPKIGIESINFLSDDLDCNSIGSRHYKLIREYNSWSEI